MSNREPKTRYGFPDLMAPYTPFPAEPPWDTPIHQLSGWWLEIECATHFQLGMPLRLMAANHGWNRTLRQIVPLLKCNQCGARPVRVDLVDDIGGDTGRFGAKTKRHSLLPPA